MGESTMTFLTHARSARPGRSARVLGLAAAALLAGALAAPASADDDPPSASVSGRVTDAATGVPLGHVEVALDNVDDPMNGRGGVWTDDDGGFDFADVDPGTWILRAHDYEGRYVNASSGNFTVVAGQQVTGKDFQLVVGATITGRVVDDKTGEPVFDMGICPTAYAGRQGDAVAASGDCADADGRWYLRGLPAGSYTVHFTRDSTHAPMWAPGSATQAGAALYTVARGQSIDIGTVRMRAGGAVSGRVTDRAGRPVADAWVSLHNEDCGAVCWAEARTDADGRYRVTNVAPGRWFARILAPGQPYAWQWSGGATDPASARWFRTGFDTTTRLDVVLQPEARLAVTVTGMRPGYFTTVTAYTLSGEPVGNGGWLEVSGTGTATVTGLPASRVKLKVRSSDEYDTDVQEAWYGGSSQETARPIPVAPGRNAAVTVELPG
jgi:protocatechuate 3,4-dioxygenase beta subunit